MFDRVEEGEVWPEGEDMFDEREETVEMVEASIDMFMVFCSMRRVRNGKQRDEVFYTK